MSEHALPADALEVVGREARRDARRASPAQEARVSAAGRMTRGRSLVVLGFVVALLGVVGYCVGSLAPGAGAGGLEALVGPGLWLIAAGTLIWLCGSVVYLTGVLDAGPGEGPGAP